MSSLVPQGGASGSGTNNLVAPASNNNNTQTLPDKTGTLAMDGPAFAAYMTATQPTFSSGTSSKITFNATRFDTNSNYNTSTYRFTPTVAGYYQINVNVTTTQASNLNTRYYLMLYKNGSLYYQIGGYNGTSGDLQAAHLTTVMYFNGSTDYVETYIAPQAQTLNIYGLITEAQFSGCLLRGA